MKYILLILLFSTGIIHAQEPVANCKLTRETDPYTKLTKLSTGFIPLDGGSVTFDADAKEVDVLFTIEGADKCFDNNSTAYLFFEGSKSKSSMRNGGSMNCEGLFHFIFKNAAGTTSLLQKMSTQKITHIIFTGNNKKETTVNVPENDRQALMAMAACLVAEAKTLIK